ncbi:MAG: hypothetical protein U0136_07930 [Bdellovibrionota bacterium]
MSGTAREQRRAENRERATGCTLKISVLKAGAPNFEHIQSSIIEKRSVCFRHPDGLPEPIHSPGTKLRNFLDSASDTAYVRIEAIRPDGSSEDVAGHVLVRWGEFHPVDRLTEGRLAPLHNSYLFTRSFTVEEFDGLGINRFSIASLMMLSCWLGADALEALILPKLRVRSYLEENLGFSEAAPERFRKQPPPDDRLVECNFGDGKPVRLLSIGTRLGQAALVNAWREMKSISRKEFLPLGIRVEFDDVFTSALEAETIDPSLLEKDHHGPYKAPQVPNIPSRTVFGTEELNGARVLQRTRAQ